MGKLTICGIKSGLDERAFTTTAKKLKKSPKKVLTYYSWCDIMGNS